MGYAAQLAAQAGDGWVGLFAEPDPAAPPGVLSEVIDAAGNLLVATMRCAPDDTRLYHALGVIGAEGFAAMGAAELLLHVDDITTGLGFDFKPPEELCAPVLDRLFPESGADHRRCLAVAAVGDGPGRPPGPALARRLAVHVA